MPIDNPRPDIAPGAPTKEIFIPAQGNLGALQGPYGVTIDAAGEVAFMRMLIPQDFTSITALEVVFLTSFTGASMHFNITTWYGVYTGGENWAAHTETEVARDIGATVASEYNNHDISDLVDIVALAAGDILIAYIDYNATAIASWANVAGLRLKYN